MSINKSDIISNKSKQLEFFSDFSTSFFFLPFSGDLAKVTNERDVTQSIKNLVRTIVGERHYQSDVGCNLYHNNFELNDNITSGSIINSVTYTINNYEKRANLISVIVTEYPDQNSIIITITYSLINNPTPIVVDIPLKRVR